MERKDYYVYEHATLSGEVFYIGKGSGHRMKSCDKRSEEWHAKCEEGLKWTKLVEGLTNSEAHSLELKLIKEIGYDNLTNKKPGGRPSGTPSPKKGDPVLDIQTGIAFDGLRDACRATNEPYPKHCNYEYRNQGHLKRFIKI